MKPEEARVPAGTLQDTSLSIPMPAVKPPLPPIGAAPGGPEVVQRRTGDPRDGLVLGRVVLFKQDSMAREFPAIVNHIVEGLTVNLTVQCDVTPNGTFLAADVKHESEVTQEDNPRWRWPNR